MGLNLSKIINTFTQQAPDGKEYLRVANIAPNAYDEVTDELKVRVSDKSEIKLIKSHLNYNGLIANATAYVGDEIRKDSVQLLKPINVTFFLKRTIVIYNHHDQPLKLRTPLFFIDFSQTARELSATDLTGGAISDITIPAFDATNNVPGRMVIDGSKLPFINTALPGMGLDIRRSATAPTTGHIDIYVFGGK